ncbi:MAG: hypothetical protein HYY00_08735 [Chloroflexi bacterium]|nr:hypothetical protein [Chloroflexota bacterium]
MSPQPPTLFYLLLGLLVIQIGLFSRFYRLRTLSPVFYTIATFFVIGFVISPLLAINVTHSPTLLLLADGLPEAYLYLNVVFFFWATGLFFASRRDRFTWASHPAPSPARVHYGLVLFMAGLVVYLVSWQYVGVSLGAAYAHPFEARLKIISTPGGYYLKQVALWSVWAGFFLVYASGFRLAWRPLGLLLAGMFVVIVGLSLPFGERSLIIMPMMFVGLIAFYDRRLKVPHLVVLVPMAFVLIVGLGIYREIGRGQPATTGAVVRAMSSLSVTDFVGLGLERTSGLVHLLRFLERKDDLSMPLRQSVLSLVYRVFPASWQGGKPLDSSGYYTQAVLGIYSEGSYSPTPLAEWYMNLGLAGFIIMPLLSGFVYGKLIGLYSDARRSVFTVVLFSQLFVLRFAILNISSPDNVTTVFFFVFALMVYLAYALLRPRRRAAPAGLARAAPSPLARPAAPTA